MEEKILLLLEKKSFSELTEQEKSFVLSHISKQEYIDYFNILDISKSVISEDVLHNYSDKEMFNKIINSEKKQRFFVELFNYKISLLNVVAIFFVIFFAYHLVISHIYETKKTVEKIIVNNTDTIYKTKKIYKTDTIYLTKYKSKVIKSECSDNIAAFNPKKEISKKQFEYYKQKLLFDLKNRKNVIGKNASKLSKKTNTYSTSSMDNIFVEALKQ